MDDDTRQALIEWVNSFPLREKATGFDSLSGGQIIWEVLHDIDPSYFTGELPESSNSARKSWLSRWENLKYVYQALSVFLIEETEKDIPKGLSMLDLKIIAMESHVGESIKLLKMVLLAAISSPRSMEFIGRMPNLSLPTQNVLKEWIVEIGESPEDEPNGIDHHPNGASSDQDVDQGLVFEERIGRLMAERDKFKNDGDEMRLALEDLEERLEHSQAINSVLERKVSKLEDRLREHDANQDVLGSNKLLESKIQEQEDVIASLEGEVSGLQTSKESMQKAIDKLNSSNSKALKLQDAYDELKTERDNLARKANAAEKYKQKLQAGGDMQKENMELREELTELRQDYEVAKQARQQVTGLQRAVDEYKRVLPKIEQERHELQMMKKQLEFDNATLAQRCDKASKQYNRDQATIANLNERLGLPNSTTTSPTARHKEALDSELTEPSDNDKRLRTKITELRDENIRLQSSVGDSEAKAGMLEQMLDDVREQSEERERKHLEMYQQNLVLESSLQAMQKGQRIQDTEIFEQTKKQLVTVEKARSELEQQLKRTREELEECQNDLSMVDKDKLRQVEEIKRQQSTKVSEVQKENKALKRRTVDLETDRKGLQALLRNGINKDTSKESSIANEKLDDLLTGVKALASQSSAKANEELEKTIGDLGKIIDETNAKVSAREEQIETQNIELQNLRKSLQNLQSLHPHNQQDQPTTAKTATSSGEHFSDEFTTQAEYIANLERENRLMATAYHTLAGRLQMSNVTLQRRAETPNAWLNKQRRLVNQQSVMSGK